MKRIFALMLCLTVALGFSGCSKKSEGSKSSKSSKLSVKGSISDGKWENKYIGLGFNIPSSWSSASKEEIEKLNEQALAAMDKDLKEQVENAAIFYDAVITSSDKASSVNINLEKASKKRLANLDYTKTLEESCKAIEATYESAGFLDTNYETHTLQLGKKNFNCAKIKATYGLNSIYQYLIVIKCDNHVASITITALSEKSLNDIAERFYTL